MNDLSSTEIFLGRVEQLKQLDGLLAEVIRQENSLPRVALVYGQGGIGKSTLSRRFLENAATTHKDQYSLIEIDWQDERGRNQWLKVRPEDIDAGDVFRFLRGACNSRGGAFAKAQKRLDKAAKAFEKALRDEDSARSPGEQTAKVNVITASAEALGSMSSVPA